MSAPLIEWRLSNLLEILRFYADKYCRLAAHLNSAALQNTLRDRSPEEKRMAEGVTQTLIAYLEGMHSDATLLELESTADAIALILQRWSQYEDPAVVMNQSIQLLSTLESELRRRVCLVIPRKMESIYKAPLKGWEVIAEVFPEAQDDIEEMQRCRALGRDAAAVFHLLLVVERGLIELGIAMKVTDPKQGWDATCRALEAHMRAGRNGVPGHIKKHFTFYEMVNADIQSMKLAWRNKVSHAAHRLVIFNSEFKHETAEKIITAGHGFMLLLATEGPRKKKTKK